MYPSKFLSLTEMHQGSSHFQVVDANPTIGIMNK